MQFITLSKPIKLLLALALAAMFLVPGVIVAQPRMLNGESTSPESAGAPVPDIGSFEVDAMAIRVVDASSLEVWSGGGRIAITLIGIDAPEGNTECGRQAADVLQNVLHGTIRFEEDPDLSFDSAQRRMYYVLDADGASVAEELVRNGYAHASGEGRNADALAELESDAQAGGYGCLWNPRYPYGDMSSDEHHGRVEEPSFGLLAANLPAEFEEDVVAGGLNFATSFDFLPDGGMLIGENSGIVRLYRNGAVLPTPFIDIRSQVNDYWDRGLISVAVDPDFEANGYVYLFFTYENDPSDYTGPKTARLIRVTAEGDTASLSTQEILLGSVNGRSCNDFPAGTDCLPSDGPSHSAGDINFASDGTIFLTAGEGAAFNTVVDDAVRAQDLDLLAGKVLRINSSGEGVADNPFWNGDPQSNRSKIWAYGVRNAFRFDLQPGTDIPYLGDVGWNTTEEVNVALRGANLGWPCYEGSDAQLGYWTYQVCQDLYALGPSVVQMPIVQWAHDGAGAASAGGVFYTGANYPEQYREAYFYADYVRSWIRYFHVDGSHNVIDGPHTFATNADGPVDFEMGPDGNIYYVAINEGEIRRIRYTGDTGGDPDPPDGDVVYLSDLDWISATNGWGPVERDMSNGEEGSADGATLSIAGTTYEKGLGAHAESAIDFNLGAACHTFVSSTGVDDEVGNLGSVTFEVQVDGATVYESGVLTGGDPAELVEVSVEGASTLRLTAGDGGDGIDFDHANWADARLLCDEDDGPPPPPDDELIYLSDLDWLDDANGWGPVERDLSNGEEESGDGAPLTITGTTYDKGLGVHAASEIRFALPAECHTFASDIGVDDEVGELGSVTFAVWLDGDLAYESGVLTGTSPAEAVAVGLGDAIELRLVVADGGDDIDFDHANWADARLLCDGGDSDDPEAPSVSITSPSGSDLFQVGDEITFAGEAMTSDGGPIPDESLSWRILIHHCSPSDCHMHPFIQPAGVAGGSFEVPDHGDEFYFELRLTAEGESGLTATDIVEIHPQTVEMTVDTSPGGLQVTLGGESGPAPLTRTVVVNSLNTLSTPASQQGMTFESWAHGGPRQQNVIAGEESVTYTATFEEADVPPAEEVLYLSDLPWDSSSNGWGPVERDMSNGEEAPLDGGTLTIDGVSYDKGIGAHAISDISVSVPETCHTFVSDIGVDDEVGDLGSVNFEVWLDGSLAFDSGVLTGIDSAGAAHLSLDGASQLRLYVSNGGDDIDFDHANWADARLLCDGDGGDPPPPPAPEVTGTTPADGAGGVSVDTIVSAAFSTSMDAGSITTETVRLTVSDSGTPVDATVGYDDDSQTATLTPASPLEYGIGYTVTIQGGAGGVASTEGASLDSEYSWSFTTEFEGGDRLAEPAYYGAGTNAHGVSADDFNGDGIPDLVVANAGANTVSILFGTGGGTFSAPTDYGVGDEPKSAITADFSGDGLPDIATANQASNSVSVLLASGGGTYSPAVDYGACVGTHEVKAGDFNGDGTPDLVAACWGGSIVDVLIGNGDGSFQDAVSYDVGANPHAVVVGDFNGNGAQDLAVANHGSASMSILLGNGDGTFQPATSYESGGGPHSIDRGDFNGDGIADLVVANDGSDNVSVFLGNGGGTFQTQVTYAVGIMPKGVRVGDLNGDGALDIVTANTFDNYESPVIVNTSISVLLGNGDGSFGPAEHYDVNTTPFAVALADLNGNGRLDVATANWHSDNVGILLNQ